MPYGKKLRYLCRGARIDSHVFGKDIVVRIRLKRVFAFFVSAYGENRGISVFDIAVERHEFVATAVDFKRKGLSYDEGYAALYLVDLSYNFSHTQIISFQVVF